RVEQSKLTEILRGTRPEEIEISKVKLASASSTLSETQRSALNIINDSYAKAEDAIHNLTDQLYSNPRSGNPSLNIVVPQQLDNDLEAMRATFEPILVQWRKEIDEISPTADQRANSTKAQGYLVQVRTYLTSLALGVNALEPSASLSKTIIDGYKSDTNTARTNVNTAITNLTTADEKIRSAESAVLLADEELRLLQAGSTPEKISAQRALVDAMQARVDSLRDELSKTILRAPVGGIVVMQEARVGEFATAGKTIIAVVGDAGYEVEAYVPEVDIGGVDVGDTATLTLDAFGEDMKFTATVSTIDPAETIREGVPTYKVTLIFEDTENRVKSGMTANVDILSNMVSGVIAIPQRAVIRREGRKFVRIPSGDTYTEVEVVTGLRGSDGTIEIVSGITEGQVVITFLEE
ncbi:MAG: efflux RND transporter periplasmic adaptor subunit, partial [Patescibacteria group bacterium]